MYLAWVASSLDWLLAGTATTDWTGTTETETAKDSMVCDVDGVGGAISGSDIWNNQRWRDKTGCQVFASVVNLPLW